MTKKRPSRTEKILVAIIAVLLLALIFVEFHNRKVTNTTSTPSSASISLRTHPRLNSVQYNLILADLFLEKSIGYGIYIEEKKDALTEIKFAQDFIYKNTGEGQVVDIAAKGTSDLHIIKDIAGYLQFALNDSLLIEEDKLTHLKKNILRDHIQTALDKIIQVQKSEEKSEPQKSNP
jgi:hypothetical protein